MSAEDVVRRFNKNAMEKSTRILRRSVDLIGSELTNTKPYGGNVPFLDGVLARSAKASTEGMPKVSENPTEGENIGLVAARLKLGDSVWLGYRAIYARRQNYGFVGADSLGRVYNQQGSYFVEKAIEKWPEIVQQATDEIKR